MIRTMTLVAHRQVVIEAADGPLELHLAEAGSGPPLLLIHGWPQHAEVWRHVIPLLAGDFRLLMPTCAASVRAPSRPAASTPRASPRTRSRCSTRWRSSGPA
jgi:pimeloyl-ACP methyl ester carboxylesterase